MNERKSTTAEGSAELPTPELTLTHLDTLPTLAPIAVKLLQITTSDESDARDVVNALRGDQSLTAKILALANSPIMGATGKISTLDRAVVLLGFQVIRGLVLTIKVFECLAIKDEHREARHFNRLEFWKHSLGVACVARRVAALKREAGVDPEEAFVAGLLHDLGKVALDAVFPKAYGRAALQAEKTRSDLADCERAILGVDHTVAGRHVAKRWGLPAYLQEAIWLHHLSADSLARTSISAKLIGLIRFANTFVRERRLGHSGNHAFYEPSASLSAILGLSGNELEQIARQAVGDVAQYVSLLGLDQTTPETLYIESLASANAELGRINTELIETNRKLSASARYFQGAMRFDQQLKAQSDLSSVVHAMADAAAVALQRSRLAAFGVHDLRQAVEICFFLGREQACEHLTVRSTEELSTWLDESEGTVVGPPVHAAPAVRRLIAPCAGKLGSGVCWLLPIVHDGALVGGLVFLSERDERGELSREMDELRSFLASLGLAIGRANAQTAARRLSEDLAESNRRLQQMQAEVLRTRTLAIIAEMAAGAGHELNGPLTVISGRAQLLLDKIEDPETRRALEQIHNKAHECARIVTELMDFAKPHPPQPAPVDLNGLLAEAHDSWLEWSKLPASRLELDLPAGERPVLFVDRAQVRIVLDEVLENAVQAVEANQGRIRIAYEADIAGPWTVPEFISAGGQTDKPPAGWVEIVIEDTGCGINPTVLQRIFDPFYSHRQAGRGRGLGLARAHRIVEAHGGRIWAASQPDQGACFHITLPQIASL